MIDSSGYESRLHGFSRHLQLSGFVLADAFIHHPTRESKSPRRPEAFDSQLLLNPEEQRPKGIINIPAMTDKIYFDTGFTVV